MTMDSTERSTISGLVLHVEEYGDQPSETLTYRKSHSRIIAIGRKSSQGNPEQPDPERALFRCPVVSRKHAKITFTEYGNVYITDLRSHHGTHILRPGELVSTSLKPEVPTVVADGDLITFGKTVGRDTNIVRPVVARAELIFGGDAPQRASSPPPRSVSVQPPSTPGPAADDSQSQSQPQPQPHGRDGSKTPARAHPGRYGVFLPSPESSPSSSSSDSDSDVQEISPPPSPPQHPNSSLPSESSRFAGLGSFGCPSIPLGARLRLLQQILPPIHIADSPEPDYYPPPIEPFSFEEIFVEGGVVEEEEDMDLSSSRALSPSHSEGPREESPVVGAWPHSPSGGSEPSQSRESSVVSLPAPQSVTAHRHEVIEISDDDYGTPAPNVSVSAPIKGNEAARPAEESPEVEMVDMVFGDAESAPSPPEDLPEDDAILDLGKPNASESAATRRFAAVTSIPALEPANASVTFDTSAIEAQIAEARDEINTIRATRDADEVVFTAHVEQTKARLDALDVRMHDTQSNLTSRSDELSSIDTRLQVLKSIISGLQERNDLGERLEELVREVGTAKDMLHETCAMHEQAREQMAEELEAVKALRVEAAATVAEAKLASVAAQAAASEMSTSLKRKRDDDAEDESVPPNLADVRDLQAPRPVAKRRRVLHAVSKVAQTATMATIGAVAAWAALAFS